MARFGSSCRTDGDRSIMRQTLYGMLQEAFRRSGVSWSLCRHEDRGDGTLTVVPPMIPTMSLIEPMIALLAADLRRYNHRASRATLIQLRLALHAGPVAADAYGLHGYALIHMARLLDASVLKKSLAESDADLAVMVSEHVYETAVHHAVGLVDPAFYRRVSVPTKDGRTAGWMYLAGSRR
jgi:hypothetical protein